MFSKIVFGAATVGIKYAIAVNQSPNEELASYRRVDRFSRHLFSVDLNDLVSTSMRDVVRKVVDRQRRGLAPVRRLRRLRCQPARLHQREKEGGHPCRRAESKGFVRHS